MSAADSRRRAVSGESDRSQGFVTVIYGVLLAWIVVENLQA